MNTKDLQAARKFLALHGYVKRCALIMAPLPGFAEDITQQVFVEFISRAEQWDLDADLKPLLANTVRLVARKYWREHLKTLPPMLAKVAVQLRPPEESMENNPDRLMMRQETYEEEIAALWACMDQLPAKSRSLIHAYYFEQTPPAALAERMNVQVKSVHRAVCRVRETLRQCIEKIAGKEETHG